MGADLSTARVKTLTDMGFSVAESRLALEATSGDVQRATEILLARRQAQERAHGGALAARINHFLKDQRPWDEFFGTFLWPDHPQQRIQTNLVYYKANYAIVSAAVAGIGLLMQPRLLGMGALAAAIHFGAAQWDGPVPGYDRPLEFEQRLMAATLLSSVLVHWSGGAWQLTRIALVCGGCVLGHATFRSRTLAARWNFFRESVEKHE